MKLDQLSAQAGDMAQARCERLSFIDLRVFFCGELRRADLEERFGIAPAAATRDLAEYRRLAPGNLLYDSSQKSYTLGSGFKPLFGLSQSRALTWLREGFGDGVASKTRPPVAGDGAGLLTPPPLETLGILSRAIHQGTALLIEYLSMSSGSSSREIVPTALVDNGLRWHVRAYDRKNGRFSDFVVGRIISAKSSANTPADHECIEVDRQWNRFVDLELVPHPGISWPAAVVADYGMSGGVLLLQARAAVAGYALHRWQVDCSANHTLDSKSHHLWLRNPQTLYGVESAILAPGYAAGSESLDQ